VGEEVVERAERHGILPVGPGLERARRRRDAVPWAGRARLPDATPRRAGEDHHGTNRGCPAASRARILPAMGLHTTGRVYAIFDAKQVTERFRKREFVLELEPDGRYPQ